MFKVRGIERRNKKLQRKVYLNGPLTTSIGFALDMNFMGSLYTFVDFEEGLYLDDATEEEEEYNEDNNEVDDFGFAEKEDDEYFEGDGKNEVTK